MILILTPVYKAWDKVKMCIDHIDKNTSEEFMHVLITDSCEVPQGLFLETESPKRHWLAFSDGLSPELHRPCITKALQTGWDAYKDQKITHLFVVESDVMVPQDWDKVMVSLSALIPNWATLDVIPVDEEGHTTYPAKDHNIRRAHEIHGGHEFEVLQYGDWNAMLFSPWVLGNLEGGGWRFDDVPSHHDILLSRNFREKRGLERETWDPPLFYRTQEVKAVHHANSSRSELPEGLLTPSNPA